jgi:hypothetical protein
MRQAFAFSHGQRLGGRLERTWNGFIVNRFSARSRWTRGQGQVANGDALEMPELAILPRSASRHVVPGDLEHT